MRAKRRGGFTLIEVLIVVVIMAVLAAAVIPQFAGSTDDAKLSTAIFNLHSMRSTIEVYKGQHAGAAPSATLNELINSTNKAGTIGTGANFPYGPYLRTIPENPFTSDATVKVITNSPAVAADVTAGNGGWLYNATTGEIWLDHADHFTK